jgi:hypothetical protein
MAGAVQGSEIRFRRLRRASTGRASGVGSANREPERREMKRSRQLMVLGILLVSGAILLGGCGGGGQRLTKDEYAAKANALCAAFNKEVDALDASGSFDTVAEIAAGLDRLLPLEKKLIADLKALKPPADEEATAKKAIAFAERTHVSETEISAALKSGDMTKAQKLIAEIDATGNQTDFLFTPLGATECDK